ncbi:TetR/AcrR family transcriptional regulator [Actinomadura algeriensis]|uniref:AcrR family transcriptional regulator n=1 Tax=Actinomadura algeriensis TaxID=1679523 RepID=A0ABR9JRW7_9ACTN|nr:TetR/AcrR family transcriptional regulator C-terminal domain-containing protein [Actinomadura algeriensis]MBE1533303.1 AcrR family transcriptional regulator [Actinomadura algeriensis]
MSSTTGRRAWGSISRDEIVGAALGIVRRDGIGALTIRGLAADLGVSRMAIYRHVADKDELVAAVLDAIAAQDVVPSGIGTGPWPDRLRRVADGMRRELGAYPGMIDALVTHGGHGPGALRLVETILEILADAGLDERAAVRYYLVFVDLVMGRLHREVHGDPVAGHRDASLHAKPGDRAGLPRLRAAAPHLRDVTSDDVRRAELDMFVLAVETEAARR